MGHRLPEHFGKCKNIHGHSYKMVIELEGDVNEQGIVLDFYDLKKNVEPILEDLDHSFMVFSGDIEIISFLEKINSKKTVVDFNSTVENIARYILSKISENGFPPNISALRVKIYESPSDFAEAEKRF